MHHMPYGYNRTSRQLPTPIFSIWGMDFSRFFLARRFLGYGFGWRLGQAVCFQTKNEKKKRFFSKKNGGWIWGMDPGYGFPEDSGSGVWIGVWIFPFDLAWRLPWSFGEASGKGREGWEGREGWGLGPQASPGRIPALNLQPSRRNPSPHGSPQ